MINYILLPPLNTDTVLEGINVKIIVFLYLTQLHRLPWLAFLIYRTTNVLYFSLFVNNDESIEQ